MKTEKTKLFSLITFLLFAASAAHADSQTLWGIISPSESVYDAMNLATAESGKNPPGLHFRNNSSKNDWWIWMNESQTGDLFFSSETPDVANQERVVFKRNGSVGIGTTNPSHKLEVNGTIRAKEVIVETTGWPDYVFAPGYALPTLDEVNAHIQELGRLPGVPAASEVDAAGQTLGETQRLIMQKIEELTLYAIEKDKRVNELESKNKRLEARLEKTEAALAKMLHE